MRGRAPVLVLVASVAIVAIGAACGAFTSGDEDVPSPVPEAGGGGDAPAPTGPASTGGQTGVDTGAPRLCKDGNPPDASVETCFDGVDNECNGVVDDGCPCTAAFDICTKAIALEKGFYYALFPAQPKAGEPFDLFVLTQGDFTSSGLDIKNAADGGLLPGCAGGGSIRECASLGSACESQKWKGQRHHIGPFAAVPLRIEIWSPNGSGGCGGGGDGQKIDTIQVQVQ